MKNHIYSYKGQLFRQKRGAAIGLKLSGSLAVFATQVWSKRFNDLLAEANSDTTMLKLYMSSYYMDDGNWAARALPPGCRLVEGKLEIVQSEVENDCQIPADIRTGKIIQEIGNSINNYIRLTVDTGHSVLTPQWLDAHPEHPGEGGEQQDRLQVVQEGDVQLSPPPRQLSNAR